MSDHDMYGEIVRQAKQFHDETPHKFQTSLSLSIQTRDVLGEIRDDLNDRAGEPVLNTTDVVRLALQGAARYHELNTDMTTEKDEEIQALTVAIHDAINNPANEK